MLDDSHTNEIIIPDEVLEKWQRIVNIIAEILKVPTVIITRLEPPDLKAYRTSQSRDNPVKEGYSFPLGGEDIFRGIYCEWVITRKKKLLIPNASADDDWHRSLGSRFGLISYIGLPLLLPDGEIFGSICAMDSKVNEFSVTYEMLLAHFKDLIESHLNLLYQQLTLERQVADLQRMEAELRSYRDHLEEQVSRRTRDLATTNANLMREIAERAKTENALKESEERFRQLVENSLTGIAILRDDRLIYQNPEHARLLGPIPEPSLKLYFENIHPQDVDRVENLYDSILTGKTRSLDLDFRLFAFNENAEQRAMQWVQCRASQVNFGGDNAVFLNLMDITHTKELEHLMRIEDKMSSLGRVAAGIAHEIRNPLSAMNMYLKALQTTITDAGNCPHESPTDAIQIFAKIQAAVRKIEFIIKRVMDFSKPTAPLLTKTSINQAIQKAIDLCAVTVRKAGIQMETDLCPDLPDCLADSQMIEQVLLNLITNATQALADKDGLKKIRITSETTSSAIIATVSDSGTGVPVALLDTIFDPFFTTRKTGSGIGLSLVRRIVMDHGGSLEVIPSIWGGAEFKFAIPLSKRHETR